MNDELQKAVAALMKESFEDTGKRKAFAEMIVEYAEPGHIMTDFVGLLLNTRALKPGDMLVKKVRKGIKVYTFVPGAIPLSSQLTVQDRANYVLDGAVVDVNFSEWDLRSGELGTVESIRSEMQAKMRDYIMGKVFTALTTIWTATNTPSNYTDCGGNVTKVALDAMIETINQTTPGAKAIVGTRQALYPITSFVGWDTYGGTNEMIEGIAEELRRTGWIGQYRGVPIVVIPQNYDFPDTYNKLIPTDKILVVGTNVGEFITFGEAGSDEWRDPRPIPPQQFVRSWQQFGMIIDSAEGIGVLKVS